MDWMYQGISNAADREEYLTGRKIDKTFELIENEENPNTFRSEEDAAFINQLANNVNTSVESLSKNDINAKMREDPLFEIKMKQIEQRKKILQNPLRLKEIEAVLKSSLEKDKKKHKKKSKKKHKSKKSKKSSSRKHHKSHADDSSASDSDSSVASDHDHQSESKSEKERHQRANDHYYHSSKSSSSSKKRTYDHHERRYSDRRDRSSSSNKPHRTLEKDSHRKQSPQPKKSKMSAEEMEQKLREMMQNAQWRDKTRAEKVNKMNEEEQREEIIHKSNSSANAEFIKPLLSSIASGNTVEDSIRQKRFKLQRGSGSMDVNFARRN